MFQWPFDDIQQIGHATGLGIKAIHVSGRGGCTLQSLECASAKENFAIGSWLSRNAELAKQLIAAVAASRHGDGPQWAEEHGLMMRERTADFGASMRGPELGLEVSESALQGFMGACVTAVAPGSAADEAGLAPGADLVAVAGKKITTPSDVAAALKDVRSGEPVTVTWFAEGIRHRVEVTMK